MFWVWYDLLQISLSTNMICYKFLCQRINVIYNSWVDSSLGPHAPGRLTERLSTFVEILFEATLALDLIFQTLMTMSCWKPMDMANMSPDGSEWVNESNLFNIWKRGYLRQCEIANLRFPRRRLHKNVPETRIFALFPWHPRFEWQVDGHVPLKNYPFRWKPKSTTRSMGGNRAKGTY